MSREGQALDIRVIGLGQAGGNLAAEFHRRGYPAIAFNTARTDLMALSPEWGTPGLEDSARVYIGIAGYDGAGADPDYGRSCVKEHAELILGRTREHAKDADLLVITAGLGGGTGSAVRELVNIVGELSIPVVCLVTLPSESESGISKVNAVRAINELLESELDGWIIVDNARLASLNQEVVARSYFSKINEQIIAPFDDLNRLNERSTIHAIRAFDGEDFRKVLLSGGILHYDVLQLKSESLDPNTILNPLLASLEEGKLMPSGFDPANISSLAVVIEASESTLTKTPMMVFDQLNDELKRATEGAAVDLGIYQTTGNDDTTTIRLISVSRGLPSRIQDVVSSARDEGRVLSDKMHERLPSLELGDIADLDLFGRGTRKRSANRTRPMPVQREVELKQSPTRREAFSVGSPNANSPSGVPAAKASPSVPPSASIPPASPTGFPAAAPASIRPRHFSTPPPLPMMDQKKNDSALEAKETNAKSEADKGAKKKKGSKKNSSEELPSAEVYDELVEDFRKNQNDKKRTEIAEHLENDFRSPHAVVRFYAIDAMAKIDRKLFESSLLAATEDENTAVRKIAKAALQR
ncbi:MAG: hypothetical protein IPJ88_03795 [Myxococcales bacterium]|nr:MAG: hypothetical protein IPJ88_03795 [Myxococcales bacterium]